MRGNGDIPRTLELVWLILVHMYALVDLLINDHPNIVQMTHLLINYPMLVLLRLIHDLVGLLSVWVGTTCLLSPFVVF